MLICVLTPMTSPSRFTSGPPELPGIDLGVRLDVAAHERTRHLGAMPSGGALATDDSGRDRLIDAERLPMASTQSPTSMASELPRRAETESPGGFSIRTTATSVSLSRPTTLPGNSRPSASSTFTFVAPSTT